MDSSSKIRGHHEAAGKQSGESGVTQVENASFQRKSDAGLEKLDPERLRASINAKIANPLAEFSNSELEIRGEEYVREHQIGDDEDIRAFRLGAVLAKDPLRHAECHGLTDDERNVLETEITHKWQQPWKLFLVIVLCSTCAAVQGMGKCNHYGCYLANPFAQMRLLLTAPRFSTVNNSVSAIKNLQEIAGLSV